MRSLLSAVAVSALLAHGLAAAADAPILDAAKNRDRAALSALLAKKADVRATAADGATALHWIVQWDDVATAKQLMAAGANVNARTDQGISPLSLACLNGSAGMVDALLAAGADPNSARNTGETALMTCAKTGSLAAVKALLDKGANVAAVEKARGQSALMWAAAHNHADVIKLLLAHGADVQSKSSGAGFTPLLFAARQGATAATVALLDAGADINAASNSNLTPLIAAVYTGSWDLAKLLLDRGADPNFADAGFTALHWAAGSWENDLSGSLGPEGYEWIGGRGPGKLELVKALLAKGADPNARLQRRPPRYGYGSGSRLNMVGATPFILAAFGGNAAIMQALLDAGADPHLTTNDGTTALMTAAGFGRIHGESRTKDEEALSAAKLALSTGIDVNAANAIGETALHAAAYAQSDPVVTFLIEQGANVNAHNQRGETPLVLAEGFTGSDTGGNTFYSDSTAEVLRKAGGVNRMEFTTKVVKIETSCPNPTFLVADPTSNLDRYADSYGSALRIKPADGLLQFTNARCDDLKPDTRVRITGTRLGHLLDKAGHPWDGSIDASSVEILR